MKIELEALFSETEQSLLRELSLFVEGPLFLVGGFVRDVLLERDSVDVDFLIVSDLEDLLKKASNGLECEYRYFEKFMTGKLFLSDRLFRESAVLDFAQARKESYPNPGSEPIVAPGSLLDDALRRDFSINALRLEYSDSQLVVKDEVSGVADLTLKKLRVLHENSFVDDPARLLRGMRLACRLGFEFEAETKALLESGLENNLLSLLPAHRMRSEFLKLVAEDDFFNLLSFLIEHGYAEVVFGCNVDSQAFAGCMAKLSVYDNIDVLIARLLALSKSIGSSDFVSHTKLTKKDIKKINNLAQQYSV